MTIEEMIEMMADVLAELADDVYLEIDWSRMDD